MKYIITNFKKPFKCTFSSEYLEVPGVVMLPRVSGPSAFLSSSSWCLSFCLWVKRLSSDLRLCSCLRRLSLRFSNLWVQSLKPSSSSRTNRLWGGFTSSSYLKTRQRWGIIPTQMQTSLIKYALYFLYFSQKVFFRQEGRFNPLQLIWLTWVKLKAGYHIWYGGSRLTMGEWKFKPYFPQKCSIPLGWAGLYATIPVCLIEQL